MIVFHLHIYLYILKYFRLILIQVSLMDYLNNLLLTMHWELSYFKLNYMFRTNVNILLLQLPYQGVNVLLNLSMFDWKIIKSQKKFQIGK